MARARARSRAVSFPAAPRACAPRQPARRGHVSLRSRARLAPRRSRQRAARRRPRHRAGWPDLPWQRALPGAIRAPARASARVPGSGRNDRYRRAPWRALRCARLSGLRAIPTGRELRERSRSAAWSRMQHRRARAYAEPSIGERRACSPGCGTWLSLRRLRRSTNLGPRPRPAGRRGLERVLGDELLGLLARLIVWALVVGGLHQVGGGPVELAADAVVERKLAAAHRVDHDARRVGRVPHLELHLHVERHVAEGLALDPDVGPLAVG